MCVHCTSSASGSLCPFQGPGGKMLPQSKQQSLLGGCGDQGQARCLLKVPQYGRVRQDSYLVWLAHSAVCAILDSKQGTLSLSTRLQPLNLLCQLWELSGQGSWKSSTGDSQTPSSQLVNRDTITVQPKGCTPGQPLLTSS